MRAMRWAAVRRAAGAAGAAPGAAAAGGAGAAALASKAVRTAARRRVMRYELVSTRESRNAKAHLPSGAEQERPEQQQGEQQEPGRRRGELHTCARRRSSSSAGQLPPHHDTLQLTDLREHCECSERKGSLEERHEGGGHQRELAKD